MKGALFFFSLAVVCTAAWFLSSSSTPITIIQEFPGETDPLKLQASYNRALEELIELEERYQPLFGNGKLYYDIGNVYYRLGEYPLALYYYERAKALRPLDANVAHQLSAARQKLGFPAAEKASPFAPIFFVQNVLSIPRQLQLFAFFTLASIAFSCLMFYRRTLFVRLVWCCSLAFALFLGLGLGYQRSMVPMEAIVISGSLMYRAASFESSRIEGELLLPGEKVQVFDVLEDGYWLKVEAGNRVGYLPNRALRVI